MESLLALLQNMDWQQQEFQAPPPIEPSLTAWQLFWFWLETGPLWLLYIAFLLWMILYCVRNDPQAWMWLWIMLIVQPFGALLYFLIRYLPSSNYEDWGLLKRWRKLQSLHRLESAAVHIGNAYQFIQLGDALRELGKSDRAAQAYGSALEKEPENLQALWGAANLDFLKQNYSSARSRLSRILERDFTYKFGDVSLLYGKTLLALHEQDEARAHLEKHVRKWRQAEALFLLARLCVQQSDVEEARTLLQGLIVDINSSPRAIARKQLFWKGRAARLLRHLSR